MNIYTDHKNLTRDGLGLTSDRVARWQILLEEYAPEIIYIKYRNNIWRSQQTVLSMENVSWEIFGDMCEYGHVGWWDMFREMFNVLTPQLDYIWRWV